MLSGVAADVLDAQRLEAELADVDGDGQVRAALLAPHQDLRALEGEPEGGIRSMDLRRRDQRDEQI